MALEPATWPLLRSVAITILFVVTYSFLTIVYINRAASFWNSQKTQQTKSSTLGIECSYTQRLRTVARLLRPFGAH